MPAKRPTAAAVPFLGNVPLRTTLFDDQMGAYARKQARLAASERAMKEKRLGCFSIRSRRLFSSTTATIHKGRDVTREAEASVK